MSRPTDDLTDLLRRPPAARVEFRQATILTFDQSTAQNSVNVSGTILTDLPVLSGSESLEYQPGDVVVLVCQGASWAILGRVVTPNSSSRLAPSAVGFSSVGASAVGADIGTITTAWAAKITRTMAVPIWANRMLAHCTANASAKNPTGAGDYLNLRITIDGAAGGSAYHGVGPTGAFPDDYATVAVSAVRETAVTGGATVTVTADLRSDVGTWTSEASNIVNLDGTAVFRREG